MNDRSCYFCANYDYIGGGCFETGKHVCADYPACDMYYDVTELPDEPND